MTAVPGRKRFLFMAVSSLVGAALGLLLFEITVRLFIPVSDFLWQWDSRIGMKLVPGMHGRFVKRGLFDVAVDVNSLGFRDREHTVDKQTGIKRVVLLGDSFIEALQVPFEESISAQLEDKLTHQAGGTEVINFGVSATGTARHYLALREYGLQYKPDVVLAFFVGNDIGDNSRRIQARSYVPYPQTTSDGKLAHDEAGRLLFTPFADENSRFAFINNLLKNYLKSYRLIREAIDNSSGLPRLLSAMRLKAPNEGNIAAGDNFGFYEIYRIEQKPVWAEAWRVTEQLLVELRNLTESNGARFAVVLVPGAWEVYPQLWDSVRSDIPGMRHAALDLEQPSKRLATFLTAHGITVITLLPEFRKRAGNSGALYVQSDAHWTAEGHRLAADLLVGPVSAMLKAKLDSNRSVAPVSGGSAWQ